MIDYTNQLYSHNLLEYRSILKLFFPLKQSYFFNWQLLTRYENIPWRACSKYFHWHLYFNNEGFDVMDIFHIPWFWVAYILRKQCLRNLLFFMVTVCLTIVLIFISIVYFIFVFCHTLSVLATFFLTPPIINSNPNIALKDKFQLGYDFLIYCKEWEKL